jgi:hypothetical protein
MTRLGDVRKGLKDRLATINGLQPYATMPANPQTPSAAVIPRAKRLLSFDGDATWTFAIWVYVNSQDLTRAQTAIDEYLSDEGAKSIEVALEGDPSLGGVAQDAHITGWAEYAQLVDIGGVQVLGCRLDVEVMA